MAEFHLYDPATGTHYSNGGYIPQVSPVPFAGGQWIEGPAPAGATLYQKLDPLTAIQDLIQQGQQQMSADPLPVDLRLQIYQLAAALPLCGTDLDAIRAAIGSVDVSTRQDVNDTNKALVEALKGQMLEALNA